MAANIYNSSDYNDIIKRITSVNENSKRKWGVMTTPQMLQHCGIQLKLALGILPGGKPEGLKLYRTGIGRWLALYVFPWPKGTKTPSQMNLVKQKVNPSAIESAREELLELLEQILQADQLNPHPFFGNLNKKYWGRLIWKHLDHHLRQFGH